MERLTIKAVSPESGRAMLAALSGFHAELLEAADGSEIVVTMDGDSEIVAVLNALERHVTERKSGPAQVELDGHSYVVHPKSEAG
jgi:hypothetical protein